MTKLRRRGDSDDNERIKNKVEVVTIETMGCNRLIKFGNQKVFSGENFEKDK